MSWVILRMPVYMYCIANQNQNQKGPLARGYDSFYGLMRNGHHHFDLKGYVSRRLRLAGVEQIAVLPCDTYAEPERFFSYRRACHQDEADYGRLLSAICLER